MAGLVLGGFAPAAQVSRRILDQRGAKRAVVLGARSLRPASRSGGARADELSQGAQWVAILISGAGMSVDG